MDSKSTNASIVKKTADIFFYRLASIAKQRIKSLTLQSSNDKYCLGRRLYFCCPNARNKNARGIKGSCVIARQNPKLSAT